MFASYPSLTDHQAHGPQYIPQTHGDSQQAAIACCRGDNTTSLPTQPRDWPLLGKSVRVGSCGAANPPLQETSCLLRPIRASCLQVWPAQARRQWPGRADNGHLAGPHHSCWRHKQSLAVRNISDTANELRQLHCAQWSVTDQTTPLHSQAREGGRDHRDQGGGGGGGTTAGIRGEGGGGGRIRG